jgi:hypothetical protein
MTPQCFASHSHLHSQLHSHLLLTEPSPSHVHTSRVHRCGAALSVHTVGSVGSLLSCSHLACSHLSCSQMMAQRFALERSDLVAAVGCHAGQVRNVTRRDLTSRHVTWLDLTCGIDCARGACTRPAIRTLPQRSPFGRRAHSPPQSCDRPSNGGPCHSRSVPLLSPPRVGWNR